MLGHHPDRPLAESIVTGEHHRARNPLPGRLTEARRPSGQRRLFSRARGDPESEQARQRPGSGRNLPVQLLNVAQRLSRTGPRPGLVFFEPWESQARASGDQLSLPLRNERIAHGLAWVRHLVAGQFHHREIQPDLLTPLAHHSRMLTAVNEPDQALPTAQIVRCSQYPPAADQVARSTLQSGSSSVPALCSISTARFVRTITTPPPRHRRRARRHGFPRSGASPPPHRLPGSPARPSSPQRRVPAHGSR